MESEGPWPGLSVLLTSSDGFQVQVQSCRPQPDSALSESETRSSIISAARLSLTPELRGAEQGAGRHSPCGPGAPRKVLEPLNMVLGAHSCRGVSSSPLRACRKQCPWEGRNSPHKVWDDYWGRRWRVRGKQRKALSQADVKALRIYRETCRAPKGIHRLLRKVSKADLRFVQHVLEMLIYAASDVGTSVEALNRSQEHRPLMSRHKEVSCGGIWTDLKGRPCPLCSCATQGPPWGQQV